MTWPFVGILPLLRNRCESCPHEQQERIKERRYIHAEQRAAFAANMRRWRNKRFAAALAKMIEEGGSK